MQTVGILQGRLTPSLGRGVQFFPAGEGEWEREFVVAKELGVGHIQWAFDTLQNPLLDASFRTKVKEVIRTAKIPVRNMDLQVLVTVDISTCTDDFFEEVCAAMRDIDGGMVEIPLLDASSLLDPSTGVRASRLSALERFLSVGEKYGVGIAIESDLPPGDLAALLRSVAKVGVVYDSGNSAGLGYDVGDELVAYGKRISNVHIKDKRKGGVTVPLGEGDTDFPRLFQMLSSLSYPGPVTLQVARGKDGEECETVREQILFLERCGAHAG